MSTSLDPLLVTKKFVRSGSDYAPVARLDRLVVGVVVLPIPVVISGVVIRCWVATGGVSTGVAGY